MSRPHANESVFRAVADPTRRRIIELLQKGDRAPADLAQTIEASHQTLSHHLTVLRTSGVVVQRREGRSRLYSLQIDVLRPASRWLTSQLA